MRDILYNIYILLIFITFLLILFNLMDVCFINSKNKIIKQKITYENFSNTKNEDSFCNSSKDNLEQEKKCNNLTNDNCIITNCCVLLNNKKCVSGNINGPIYHTHDNGEDINISFYNYKNKCYGDCDINK